MYQARLYVGIGSQEALGPNDSDGFMNNFVSVLHLDTLLSNWATTLCHECHATNLDQEKTRSK